MPESQRVAQSGIREAGWLLGVDTCGPTGSVALARLDGAVLEILGQTALAGRSYSATLVAAAGELLDSERPFEALKKVRTLLPLEAASANMQEPSKEVA